MSSRKLSTSDDRTALTASLLYASICSGVGGWKSVSSSGFVLLLLEEIRDMEFLRDRCRSESMKEYGQRFSSGSELEPEAESNLVNVEQ